MILEMELIDTLNVNVVSSGKTLSSLGGRPSLIRCSECGGRVTVLKTDRYVAWECVAGHYRVCVFLGGGILTQYTDRKPYFHSVAAVGRSDL